MSFNIFIKLPSDEVVTREITNTDTIHSLKATFNKKPKHFDLIIAGDEVKNISQLFPDAEVEFVMSEWAEVNRAIDWKETGFFEYGTACSDQEKEQCYGFVFPEPKDININMMPFVLGEISSLPEEYHQYWPMILQYGREISGEGCVCYLTIQESLVQAGTSQRRPGLHIETPGCVENLPPQFRFGMGRNRRLYWGSGAMSVSTRGGNIMASTVANSCKLYNVRLNSNRLIEKGFVGPHGDVSHLQGIIEKACERRERYLDTYGERSFSTPDKWNTWRGESITTMKPNTMYWFTDRTPHESLPLSEDTYRQYFRLVSEDISIWFADHSTPNPLGTVPPPEVTILKGNKFEDLLPYIPEHEADSDYTQSSSGDEQ